LDKSGTFRDGNFQKAVAELGGGEKQEEKRGKGGKKRGNEEGEKSDIFKLVKMIVQRQYDPCIVFAFSKVECERLARSVRDLNHEPFSSFVFV
jgi:ATP-dependent RNA helicase DOB1